MTQSGFIAAALLAGFILWLAANNRLSAYTAVLWGNTAQPVNVEGLAGASASSGGGGFFSGLTGGNAGQELGSIAAHAALAAVTGGFVP